MLIAYNGMFILQLFQRMTALFVVGAQQYFFMQVPIIVRFKTEAKTEFVPREKSFYKTIIFVGSIFVQNWDCKG